jgi:NifU-like protein involved in Fe-S cluster formation
MMRNAEESDQLVASSSTLCSEICGESFLEIFAVSSMFENSIKNIQNLFQQSPEYYTGKKQQHFCHMLNHLITKPTSANFQL